MKGIVVSEKDGELNFREKWTVGLDFILVRLEEKRNYYRPVFL